MKHDYFLYMPPGMTLGEACAKAVAIGKKDDKCFGLVFNDVVLHFKDRDVVTAIQMAKDYYEKTR